MDCNALRKLSRMFLFIGCLAGSVAAQASSVNLVQNGGFDVIGSDFRMSEWKKIGAWGKDLGGDTIDNNSWSGPDSSGSSSDLLLGTISNQGIVTGVSQLISTTAGQSYTLSLDWNLLSDPYEDLIRLDVLWNGQVVKSVSGNQANNTWQSIMLTIASLGGNDTLTLLETVAPNNRPFVGGLKGILVDNVSLTSLSTVPLPGAALLFGSGIIGLVGLGRKRSRCRTSVGIR